MGYAAASAVHVQHMRTNIVAHSERSAVLQGQVLVCSKSCHVAMRSYFGLWHSSCVHNQQHDSCCPEEDEITRALFLTHSFIVSCFSSSSAAVMLCHAVYLQPAIPPATPQFPAVLRALL
jgi:hypothetical protein